jgi:hypothetical protein
MLQINRLASLALIVGGIVLIILGIQAMNSFGSDISKFFTGAPTDKALWMLIGGVVALLAGSFGTFRGVKGT